MRYLLIIVLQAIMVSSLIAQTKQTDSVRQVWTGYFNQIRFTDKWGAWVDIHARTREDYFTGLSQGNCASGTNALSGR